MLIDKNGRLKPNDTTHVKHPPVRCPASLLLCQLHPTSETGDGHPQPWGSVTEWGKRIAHILVAIGLIHC